MSDPEILRGTIKVAAAYFSHNSVPEHQIEPVLRGIHRCLEDLVGATQKPAPAVPIEKSYTDDYITCLEDGEQVTLLKRYLSKHHNMTPEEYLAKWGLPEDYPFVAKSYSEKRRQIAKEQGLGKSPTSSKED